MNITTNGSSVRKFYAEAHSQHRACTSGAPIETFFIRKSVGWCQGLGARRIDDNVAQAFSIELAAASFVIVRVISWIGCLLTEAIH
jgi:hypothetical protein